MKIKWAGGTLKLTFPKILLHNQPIFTVKDNPFSPRQVSHEKCQNFGTPYNILLNIPWSKVQNHYWSRFASISKSYQQISTSHSIIESVSQSVRKLKISFIIDVKTLKFGMKPPLIPSSRFKKIQLGGPYEAQVWAIWGPFFCYFYHIFASSC